MLLAMAVACSVNEIADPDKDVFPIGPDYPEVIFATIDDQPGAVDTKVFADSKLRVLWNNDDRISYFNKYSYGYEYYIECKEGATSGDFKRIDPEGPVSGNDLDMVYAVYPYQKTTSIDNDGVISFILPAEQTFEENSFGRGANTMVSRTETPELHFKNVGSYLSFKLYGEGVDVSSITLMGNDGEKLAGLCTIDSSSGEPIATMDADQATDGISLICEPPVSLNSNSEDFIEFWVVVPPTTFNKGITFTVATSDGSVWEMSTTASFTMARNVKRSLPVLEVVPEPVENIVFADSKVKEILVRHFDSNGDEEISYQEAAAVKTFEVPVTQLSRKSRKLLAAVPLKAAGDSASVFAGVTDIESFDEIVYFTNVTEIPAGAFAGCTSLKRIVISDSVLSIGDNAFEGCSNLESIMVLASEPPVIGDNVFAGVNENCHIMVPDTLVDTYTSDWNEYADLIINIDDKVQDGCVLYYTSTDGRIVTPTRTDSFDANIVSNVYSGDRGMIIFDYPPVVVGSYAFKDCETLKSVVLPESVEVIEYGAFCWCTSLESVELPDNLFSIQLGAFNFSAISSINIPDSVEEIGVAFVYCSNLERFSGKFATTDGRALICKNKLVAIAPVGLDSYTIPDDVAIVGDYVFDEVTNLSELIIPSSVNSIGEASFAHCSGLKSISFPTGKRPFYIGENAFRQCTGLESLYFQNDSVYVRSNAFYDCSSLTSITVNSPGSFYIEPGVFANTNDCPIYVPASSVDLFKQEWNEYADRIFAEVAPDDNVIYYVSSDGQVIDINPNAGSFGATLISNVYENGRGKITFDGPISSVGDNAFDGCTTLLRISLPDSVKRIGQYAFNGCPNLAGEIDFSKISEIDHTAFQGCSSLSGILDLSNVTSIGSNAFNGCSGFTGSIDLSNVTSIGQSAFMGCSGLTGALTLSSQLSTVPEGAFSSCSFSEIVFPESIISIGNGAFEGCSSLETLYLPDSIKSLGEAAFYGCTNLKEITLPSGITNIPRMCFYGCLLDNVVFPASISEIGYGAFVRRDYSLFSEFTILAAIPPTVEYDNGKYPSPFMRCDRLNVPNASVELYKAADGYDAEVIYPLDTNVNFVSLRTMKTSDVGAVYGCYIYLPDCLIYSLGDFYNLHIDFTKTERDHWNAADPSRRGLLADVTPSASLKLGVCDSSGGFTEQLSQTEGIYDIDISNISNLNGLYVNYRNDEAFFEDFYLYVPLEFEYAGGTIAAELKVYIIGE